MIYPQLVITFVNTRGEVISSHVVVRENEDTIFRWKRSSFCHESMEIVCQDARELTSFINSLLYMSSGGSYEMRVSVRGCCSDAVPFVQFTQNTTLDFDIDKTASYIAKMFWYTKEYKKNSCCRIGDEKNSDPFQGFTRKRKRKTEDK